MRLEGIEIIEMSLQLRASIGAANQSYDGRPVLLMRIVGEDGEGWGECAALAQGTLVDPGVHAMWRSLREEAVPRLFRACSAREGGLPEASLARQLFGGQPEQRMAAGVVEMALLDAELRARSESLAEHLGVTRNTVGVGGLVGIPSDREIASLLSSVDSAVASGLARLRLKIAPDWDVEPVREVRRRYPDLALQVDANGSYRLDVDDERDARRLVGLDAFGLGCIEQPLPPADLVSHVELAELLETPVCLDESLSSVSRVIDALRYGACAVACLKPGRLGGLGAAKEAAERCQGAGVAVFIGGFFESGLARTANLVLSGLDACTLPGDLSEPQSYLVEDPFGYPSVQGAELEIPRTPGIGSQLDAALFGAHRVASEWFPFPGF
jgi:O-succinylbenzoate synthase